MGDDFPEGYVPFETVRESLPDPTGIRINEQIELETLILEGPEPTLVFIHGGLGSLWNPYVQLHTFHGHRKLLSYSLAGNGASSDRSRYSLSGHVKDLRRLIDKLGVAPPILHGWSYGTAVALEYAKKYPVEGLVLTGGGSHDLTPDLEKPLLRLVLKLRLYRLPVPSRILRTLAHRIGFHEEASGDLVKDFMKSNPLPDRRSAWLTVRDAFWGYDGREGIDRIDVPTLILQGSSDAVVPVNVARQTASELPQARLEVLKKAGHAAPVEKPAVYNNKLRNFMKSI